MASAYGTLFTRCRPGDPVRKICNTGDLNKVYTILEDIEGRGCTIIRNPDGSGFGWLIAVDGAGGAPPLSFGFKVTATAAGGGWTVGMAEGFYIAQGNPAATGQLSTGAPYATRTVRRRAFTGITSSGYVVLHFNATFDHASASWKLPAPAVAYEESVQAAGTFADIPVAKVEVSASGAVVTQYVMGFLPLSLHAPLARVASAVRDVAYDTSTGAFAKTTGPAVALAGDASPATGNVFTAVDEEI